jgi:hypothetical protein
MHDRSKHIDVHFYFLCNLTQDSVVKLMHCGSQDQGRTKQKSMEFVHSN